MEGVGVYTWNDGRRYEGEYKDDKKNGYGIYLWADNRKYLGNWNRGKQHGIGSYKQLNEEHTKFGLWEDGKRIKWFTNEDVALIKKGKLDYG